MKSITVSVSDEVHHAYEPRSFATRLDEIAGSETEFERLRAPSGAGEGDPLPAAIERSAAAGLLKKHWSY
jgi:xanthine/CO dehydrogenase XdhC/CoxF family maturation factor